MSNPTDLASPLRAPVLLLAMPQVVDPTFFHSVVLLLRHEQEGSFGFIVNRPTETPLAEILKELGIPWPETERMFAFLGGPVQRQLGSVLFAPEPGHELPAGEATTEVLPGIGLTHHVGDLETLARQPPRSFRLFLGYSAWGEGQLLDEILRNDWLIAPVDPELIFSPDPEKVWAEALRSVGIDPASLPSWTGTPGEEEAN